MVSAALMALRLDPDSPTRVYYGTDTHVMGLMLGAALAFVYAAPHRAWTTSAWWAAHRRQVAAVALVTLLGLMALGGEDSALTFRGGILLASVATTALVLVVVERPGRLRAVLELPPARWVGARSYGIYLWHWPVFLVIGQDLPGRPRRPDLPADPAVVRGRHVRRRRPVLPLRRDPGAAPRLRRLGPARHRPAAPARHRAAPASCGRWSWCSCVALVAVLLTAPDRTSTEELIAANEAELVAAAPSPAASAASAATTAATATARRRPPRRSPAVWTMPKGSEIDAFGDSMMVGAIHAMRYYLPKVRVDAKSNRKWREAPGLVARPRATRCAAPSCSPSAPTRAPTRRRSGAPWPRSGPNRMVVIVTEHGRFARAETDNEQLRAIVKDMPNVRLAEWDAALAGTSGQLQPDGIHPSLKGSHLYAKTVRQAFADLSQAHTGTAGDAQGPADALTPRGRGWQRGHENDERFMKCSRRMGVPHLRQGRPAWP